MLKVALIGRPNVGKSTLFNLLSGKKIALVDPTPGLTRDRKESKAKLFDINFKLLDTGGYDEQDNIINQKIWEQAQKGIDDSDLILFMVDAEFGLSPIDLYLAIQLRKQNKSVILCVNKIDFGIAKKNLSLFYELGFEDIIPISAMHSNGMAELYHAILPYYQAHENDEELEVDVKPDLQISFVGKPNVGKSSIINNLLKEDRVIISPIPGTTRDSIYLDFNYKDNKIKLVDTAGLRRRARVEEKIEKISNSDSISAITFSHVVVLVISAEDGLTKQDLNLASMIVNEGRGLMVVVNKIDLVKQKAKYLKEIELDIEEKFFQIKKPYVVGVSAMADKDLSKILEKALELYEKWQFKITTSKLNTWLAEVVAKNEPPSIKGRRVKLKYASQIKVRPATINIWSNFKEEFPTSYLRYIQNELYKDYNLWGSTLRLEIQASENPYKDKPRVNRREKQVMENRAKRGR
jgi:GTP-binding protein